MSYLQVCQRKCLKCFIDNSCGSIRTYAAVPKVPTTTRTGKKRFIQPAVKDAKYLVQHVSGSNLLKEGGEDVKIKDDSQYPDWIWTMHLGKPLKSTEIEYGTREYWDTLEREQNKRMIKMQEIKHNPQMRVGQNEQFKMEWQERIKYRALASYFYEPGATPNDSRYSGPHMKLWLKPQDDDEVIYPDTYARNNPKQFICPLRGTIGVPTEKRLSYRTRGYRDLKAGFLPFKTRSESTIAVVNETKEIKK